MEIDLNGKSALITGSTRGIGHAIAKSLHSAGATVFIHGRIQTDADIAASKFSGGAIGVAGELSTASGTDNLIAQVTDAGGIDILINNAGIFEPRPFFDIPDQDWMRFFEVNVMSGVRLSRAFFPQLTKKGWGRIIFISSESAINTPQEMIHYGMTKTAQLAVSRGLAELTRGTSVTVNSILPGPTRSEGVVDFLSTVAGDSDKDQSEVEKEFILENRPTSLIERFAEVEEVANMVTYIASPLSSATNGAALRVDGGVVKSVV